jgi:hypothetical protein
MALYHTRSRLTPFSQLLFPQEAGTNSIHKVRCGVVYVSCIAVIIGSRAGPRVYISRLMAPITRFTQTGGLGTSYSSV